MKSHIVHSPRHAQAQFESIDAADARAGARDLRGRR
jgi:hypothetical protein